MYFVKEAFISPASSTPFEFASKPYSSFTPPVVQFAPASSVVVLTNEFCPFVPFVPFEPFVPLVPAGPCGPAAPVAPVAPIGP